MNFLGTNVETLLLILYMWKLLIKIINVLVIKKLLGQKEQLLYEAEEIAFNEFGYCVVPKTFPVGL